MKTLSWIIYVGQISRKVSVRVKRYEKDLNKDHLRQWEDTMTQMCKFLTIVIYKLNAIQIKAHQSMRMYVGMLHVLYSKMLSPP